MSATLARASAVAPTAHRDFCLWPYEPAEPPGAESEDGGALLLLLTRAAGAGGAWEGVLASLRHALGPHATVWGLKWDGAALAVELYFYDYARTRRRVGLAQARAALDRWIAPGGVEVDPAVPYFMVSLDLPLLPGPRVPLRECDVYVGNPGSAVSSGLCHRHGADGSVTFKNLYCFFDRRREWSAFLDKLACSPHLPLGRARAEDLAPGWLAECRTVVAANKREADAAYFSGLSVAAAQRFLEEAGWPASVRAALAAERHRFAHLRLDVGFDFAWDGARVARGKSGIYGTC